AEAVWVAKDGMIAGYGDFAHFYASALLVREGRGHDLYEYSAQSKIQHELFSQVEIRTGPMVFNHPAYESLIWIPLTYLPYPSAVTAWTLINMFVLLMVSALLQRYLPNLRRVFPVPLLFGELTFYPVIVGLIQGQDSIILLGIYTLAFISLKKGAQYAAGSLFAFALFKPQLVLPFVLI